MRATSSSSCLAPNASTAYETPAVEIIEIRVELGFESSGTEGETESVWPEEGIW
ncbi:MAG: hypothetical protein ACI37U_06220 [Bacteroides sp.]